MQTKESVNDRLKELGITGLANVRKELNSIHTFLYDDEVIESAVSGYIDDHWTLIVATNKRILMLDKGIMRTNTDEFDYNKISSIKLKKKKLALARIEIKIGSVEKEITGINNQYAEHLVNFIKSRLYNDNKTVENITNNSLADEIRKLKELVDEGILTNEEFEQKKKKMLGI